MRQPKPWIPAMLASLVLTACGGNNTTKNNENNGDLNNTSTNNQTNQNNVTDMCEDVTCDAPSAACVGQIAVTYSGPGSCDATTGTCDFETVEVRTDCTMTGQNCVGGACVDIEDLCAGVTCDTPPTPPTCDAGVAVTFTGMCDAATGMCDYMEVRTDCIANAQVCAMGACVDPTPEPNPGELVVTEVMPNPAAVGDGEGEWFEIFNATARELDLNGLSIVDDGGDTFAIPAATPMLAAGEYLVFGVNGDNATNGGLDVDIVYTGISLANTADELVIVNAAMVEIDRVAWDAAAGWLVPAGSSIGFGSQFDVVTDDNNDAQFWCAGTTVYGDGDSGTPGAANDMCPVSTPYTLYEIADDNDANHPPLNALVIVTGVALTALDAANGRGFVQDPTGGEFSGVFIDTGALDVSALAVGDVVDLEGVYSELQGQLAQIAVTTITDSGNDMSVAPELVDSSVLADPITAEPWEGVLLQINEAGVTDSTPGGNGEILVDSNIIVDDLFFAGFTTAAECEVYEMIVGPLNYFGAHKIEPRDANDIGAAVMATNTTSVTQQGMAFTPAAICITAGDTVTWTNMDALAHSVTQRTTTGDGATNTNIPATPLFDEALPGNGSATVTFADPGTYHYRCRPHFPMEGVVVVPDP